ncbi:MAG: M55 family metallopeptidase [Oscillospiraceae bacterium]|nr:M55 family metallopeptidase [Oscillospiraceae bacterium]
MKIYINTDLEGICSFVDRDEANIKTARGIGYTKHFLTAEVNAAAEGILSAQPDCEITVLDGHGGGHWGANMIAEELHPRISLIHGKRGAEIVGLDSSFDLFMEIGAHSMAGTMHGVMNHTISSKEIMNVWLCGEKIGEIGIRAAIAGHYGVPVALVSGDFWAVEEAKALLGDIEGVSVKKGINAFTANCLNPLEARKLIKEAARAAVLGRRRFTPYIVKTPAEIKIEYMQTHFADRAQNSGAKRIDGRTVSFIGDDLIRVLDTVNR